MKDGKTEVFQYITKSWGPGTGGFSWTCETSGYYFISTVFSGVQSGGSMSGYKLQLKCTRDSSTWISADYGIANYKWEGTMENHVLDCILYLKSGDILKPYIHTQNGGVKVDIRLNWVLLRTQ